MCAGLWEESKRYRQRDGEKDFSKSHLEIETVESLLAPWAWADTLNHSRLLSLHGRQEVDLWWLSNFGQGGQGEGCGSGQGKEKGLVHTILLKLPARTNQDIKKKSVLTRASYCSV